MEINVNLADIGKQINDTFFPLLWNEDRFLVLYGGAGSGKSVFVAQKIVTRCLNEPGHRILVIRKVHNTIRHSTFAEIQNVISEWGLSKLFKANKTNMSFQCKNGSQIISAGLDDVDKLKSISKITSVWVEEADQLTPEDFRQLNLRMRGRSNYYKQIIVSFNPVSALSWLKIHFFDTVRKNCTIHKSTYLDNRFLPQVDKDQIEELKDQDYVMYQVYALGEWGVLGNLIYTNWTVDDVSTDRDYYEAVFCGMDFGFNNPSAMCMIGLKDDELHVFDEFYQNGLTNSELIDAVEIPRGQRVIGDSSEPDRIKEFKDAGVRIVGAKKEKGSVQAGIDYLKRKKIHIHPHCVNFIKEIQAYKYREDKNGVVYEEPIPINDHLMDCARYALDEMRRTRLRNVSLGANQGFQRRSPNRI